MLKTTIKKGKHYTIFKTDKKTRQTKTMKTQ